MAPRTNLTSFVGIEVDDEKNWYAEGKVTEIKDQGKCGANWAFATVAAVESANAISGHYLQNYSEQQVIDCDCTMGCEGGDMTVAFEYIKDDNPLMLEADYPYIGHQFYRCKYDYEKGYGTVSSYASVIPDS